MDRCRLTPRPHRRARHRPHRRSHRPHARPCPRALHPRPVPRDPVPSREVTPISPSPTSPTSPQRPNLSLLPHPTDPSPDAPLDPEVQRLIEQITQTLSQLPDAYLTCRDLKHAWSVLSDFHPYAYPSLPTHSSTSRSRHRVTHVARDLTCPRCTVQRHELYVVVRYSRSLERLERVSQYYTYPPGYLLTHVLDISILPLVRQESYRRALAALRDRSPSPSPSPSPSRPSPSA